MDGSFVFIFPPLSDHMLADWPMVIIRLSQLVCQSIIRDGTRGSFFSFTSRLDSTHSEFIHVHSIQLANAFITQIRSSICN